MRFRVLTEERHLPYVVNGTTTQPLNEANLNRVVGGHNDTGYVIISACRSKANLEKELGKVLTDEEAVIENNRRTKELKTKILNDNEYSFIPVFGAYKEAGTENVSFESSYVIYPIAVDRYFKHPEKTKIEPVEWNEFLSVVMKWGNEYRQDSIAVKYPNGSKVDLICSHPHTADEGEEHSIGEVLYTFTGTVLNDVMQEYFTALKKFYPNRFKGKPQSFAFECLVPVYDYNTRMLANKRKQIVIDNR